MLDLLHADIWTNILPYLNQFELNSLIRVCRLLKNQRVFHDELQTLKKWTENRADIKYINPNFIAAGNEYIYMNMSETDRVGSTKNLTDVWRMLQISATYETMYNCGPFMVQNKIGQRYTPYTIYIENINEYHYDQISGYDLNNIKESRITMVPIHIDYKKYNVNYYSTTDDYYPIIDEYCNTGDIFYSSVAGLKIQVKINVDVYQQLYTRIKNTKSIGQEVLDIPKIKNRQANINYAFKLYLNYPGTVDI